MQNPDHSKAEGSEKKESLSEKKTDKPQDIQAVEERKPLPALYL